MGNLPLFSVIPNRPFYVAGPFDIKDGQLRDQAIIKAYMCIVVCVPTKATTSRWLVICQFMLSAF